MPTDSPGRFSDLIGLTFTDVEPGYSRAVVDATDRLSNPYGTLHGGVLYSMADTGMGAALSTGLDEGERCATVEIKVNYLRPVRDGRVACETTVVYRGRSIAYLESELTREEEPVARATGTYSIFTPSGDDE